MDYLIIDIWASVAAVFTVTSISLSIYEIICHLCNYTKPYLQRYIIRILLIVPIYSLNAWVAMIIPSSGLYFDSTREIYESFVIYSFMKYLLNFLQYDTNLQQYINFKPAPRHIFPFCFLPRCDGGKEFMLRCKHGILQYVVIRPLTTLIAFISKEFGFYGENQFNPLSGYTFPVLLIINNISQFTAMYCLIIFYTGYKQELRPMKPLAKFLSIKLVVFFSFFQQVLLSGLIEINYVEDILKQIFPNENNKILIAKKCQEFLICIDMLIAAFGHLFAFSYKPFVDDEETSTLDIRSISHHQQVQPGIDQHHHECQQVKYKRNVRQEQKSCCQALGNILDFSDEKSDVSEHFNRIRRWFTFRGPLPTVISSTSSIDENQSLTMSNDNPNSPSAGDRSPINGGASGLKDTNYQSFD